MSKLLKNKGWKPVKLEGPIVANDLDGLVGIEELSNYNLKAVPKPNKVSSNYFTFLHLFEGTHQLFFLINKLDKNKKAQNL